MVEQYEVYWVELDPTRGGEMAKTRPCVVVTPSDLNMYLTTVVIVPITSTIRNYPIETIVYGIKNIKQEFIENGRKEIYKRTYKD